MAFDLTQMRAFSAVATCGSLGRAAAVLNITQPALSRAIKRLESHFGVDLFERHAKGMQLTEYGHALMLHAGVLLHEAEAAQEEISALRGLSKGVIRVGAVSGIACMVLPEAISRVTAKWPNLRVQLLEAVDERLTEALLRHEIDVALAVDRPDSEEIVAIKDCRWTDHTRIVAAPGHPLRRKRRLVLADTLGQRWAIPPRGTRPYSHMEQTFAQQGLPMPEIVVETFSILAIRRLVMHSNYLSWLNEPMFAEESRVGTLRALDAAGGCAQRTLTAFRRRAGMLPRPAVQLLAELRSVTVP